MVRFFSSRSDWAHQGAGRRTGLFLCLLLSILVGICYPVPAVTANDRMVFANIMLCQPPLGLNPSNPFWWVAPTRPWINNNSSRPSIWCSNVNAPDMTVQGYADMIRAAKQYGIDGFIVDITSVKSDDMTAFTALVTAAANLGNFYICVQPDLTCGGITPQSIKPLLDATASSPAYLKINDKPVICPYCCGYDVAAEKTNWNNWYTSQGMPIAYLPCAATNLNFYVNNDPIAKDTINGYQTFTSAITSFNPSTSTTEKQRALKYWGGLLPYMPDVFFQYQNTGVGYLNGQLSQAFRDNFTWAIQNRNNGVAWVMPACYNDFGESASLPNSNFFMALAPLHKYYADWFKTGTPPVITQDSVSIFHRLYPDGVTPSLYPQFGKLGVPDDVEAVALLTKPAMLYIKTGNITYHTSVGSGLQTLRKPFQVGIQQAWIERNGKTVCSVTSPVPIHNDPIRSNVWIAGYGSAYPPQRVALTNWSTLSGELTGNGAAASGTGVALVGPTTTLIDYRFTARVTPSSGSNGTSAGVIVYAQGKTYFSFAIGNWNDTQGWHLSRVDNGTENLLLSGTTSYTANTTHILRLDKVGDYLMAYLDGTQVAHTADWGTPKLSWDDARWGYGQGGVLASGASASFNDILLERYQPDLSQLDRTVAQPVLSPSPALFGSAQKITLSCATSGATICYTTDGSMPTLKHGTVFKDPINISSTKKLSVIAYKTGMTNSTITAGVYTINSGVVAIPTFSPAGSKYAATQTVTIACATKGTSIIYTTDGSIPTEPNGKIGVQNGVVYTGPIIISATTVLTAIAYKANMWDSAVASITYIIHPNGGGLEYNMTFDGNLINTGYLGNTGVIGGSSYGDLIGYSTDTLAGAGQSLLEQNTRLQGSDAQFVVLPPDYGLFDIGNTGGATAMTITAWIKPADITSFKGIVNRMDSSNKGWAFVQNNDTLRLMTDAGAVSTDAGSLVAKQWQFVAMVWNQTAGTVTFYKDGVQIYTGTAPLKGTALPSQPVEVASANHGYNGFIGNIDTVQIYDTALTLTDMQKIYNSQHP